MAFEKQAPSIPELDIKLMPNRQIEEAISRVGYWKQFGISCITQYAEAVEWLQILTFSVWPTPKAEKDITTLERQYESRLSSSRKAGSDERKGLNQLRKEYADKKLRILMILIKDRKMWGHESEYSEIGFDDEEPPE